MLTLTLHAHQRGNMQHAPSPWCLGLQPQPVAQAIPDTTPSTALPCLLAFTLPQVIIGDTFSSLVRGFCGEGWWADRRVVITVLGVLAAFPLCLIRRLGHLAGINAFATVGFIYAATLVAGMGAQVRCASRPAHLLLLFTLVTLCRQSCAPLARAACCAICVGHPTRSIPAFWHQAQIQHHHNSPITQPETGIRCSALGCVQTIAHKHPHVKDVHLFGSGSGPLFSLSIFVFGFMCHSNAVT